MFLRYIFLHTIIVLYSISAYADVYINSDYDNVTNNIELTNKTVIAKIMPSKNLLNGSSFELGDRYYTVGWAGYTREMNGYQNITEYERAENGSSSGRQYNTSDKVDGHQSLELKHDSYNVRTYLISEPIITGCKRTNALFSVYMKAVGESVNVDLVVLSGILGTKLQKFKTSIKVDSHWRRYSVVGEISQQGQGMIVFKNKGVLLIDAAMIELTDKETPSEYQPKNNFDCFVKSKYPFGVSFIDNPLGLTLYCLNRKKISGHLSATVRFIDYHNNTIKTLHTNLLTNAQYQTVKLPDYHFPTGYYKIRCEINHDGKIKALRENAIAIVPERNMKKNKDNPFGIHINLISRNLHLVKMLGVSMVRTHVGMETKWLVLEPQKGRIQDITDILEVADNEKVALLGSLDYTPLWASTIKEDFPSLSKFNMPQDLWYYAKLFPPKNMGDMLNYVSNTVSRYNQHIQYWETWNEVHLIDTQEDRINKPISTGFIHLTINELLNSSKQIYSTIKNINKDCVVVGQYACKSPYLQFDKVIKAGCLQYIDKLSVHFYQGLGKGTPPDEYSNKGEPPLRQQVMHWKALMKESGKTVGFWDTEFGIARCRTNYDHWKYIINWDGCSQIRSISYIIKSYLVKMSLGFEKVFYYSLLPRANYVYSYNPFLEFDYRPQPALAAFAVMTKLFDEVSFLPDVIDDKYCHIVKAKNNNGFVYALWMKSPGAGIKFELPYDKSISAFNVMYERITSLPLVITEEPIYIQSNKQLDDMMLSSYKLSDFSAVNDKKKNQQPDLINTGL